MTAENLEEKPDLEPVEETVARETSQDENRGTFLPLIFGGAFTVALGFFAGQLDFVEDALGLRSERELPVHAHSELGQMQTQVTMQADGLESLRADQQTFRSEMETQIDELLNRPETAPLIDALTKRVTALEERPAETTIVQSPQPVVQSQISRSELDALSEEFQATQAIIAELTSRVAALEARPEIEPVSLDEVEAVKADAQALLATVATQKSEIDAILEAARLEQEAAEAQAMKARANAALSQILAAFENGDPYAEPLAELEASSDVDVPGVLKGFAADGIPTLASLQIAFPDTARAALRASRSAAAADGSGGGVSGFFQRQLGVRSLEPKEGNDPDAILSRASAAVEAGQIDVALQEIGQLPQAGLDASASWREIAQGRVDARSAVEGFVDSVNSN